jgi:hypothetical protein
MPSHWQVLILLTYPINLHFFSFLEPFIHSFIHSFIVFITFIQIGTLWERYKQCCQYVGW